MVQEYQKKLKQTQHKSVTTWVGYRICGKEYGIVDSNIDSADKIQSGNFQTSLKLLAQVQLFSVGARCTHQESAFSGYDCLNSETCITTPKFTSDKGYCTMPVVKRANRKIRKIKDMDFNFTYKRKTWAWTFSSIKLQKILSLEFLSNVKDFISKK